MSVPNQKPSLTAIGDPSLDANLIKSVFLLWLISQALPVFPFISIKLARSILLVTEHCCEVHVLHFLATEVQNFMTRKHIAGHKSSCRQQTCCDRLTFSYSRAACRLHDIRGFYQCACVLSTCCRHHGDSHHSNIGSSSMCDTALIQDSEQLCPRLQPVTPVFSNGLGINVRVELLHQ